MASKIERKEDKSPFKIEIHQYEDGVEKEDLKDTARLLKRSLPMLDWRGGDEDMLRINFFFKNPRSMIILLRNERKKIVGAFLSRFVGGGILFWHYSAIDSEVAKKDGFAFFKMFKVLRSEAKERRAKIIRGEFRTENKMDEVMESYKFRRTGEKEYCGRGENKELFIEMELDLKNSK